MGRQDEAVINYLKALHLKPDYPEAHNNLGTTLNEMGRLDQAKTSYEQAINLKPDYAEAHYHLGLIKTFENGDPQIAVMEKWGAEPDLDITNQVFFSFALAKAYDDIGEYSKSFEQLQNANRLRKQELNYKFFTDQVHFSAIKNVFSTRKLPPFPPPTAGGNSVRPIFILGMPRSGTSLVEQVLASHSTVHGAGELTTLKNLITPALFTLQDTDLQSQESFHNDILSLRKDYLDSLELLGVPERVITDKMPHNFKWIGWILLAFPEARIIHLNRDPVAICFSIFKRRFPAAGLGYGYDLNDLAAFYHLYRDLMSFWRERFPNEIYELDYEEFTENQEVETRKLIAFCDLDWEDQCLEFHNTQRIVKTASAVQVQQPLYQGSSEAWKKYKSYLEPLTQALHK
jgi:tetratricopeptide (TPR) repeat protein